LNKIEAVALILSIIGLLLVVQVRYVTIIHIIQVGNTTIGVSVTMPIFPFQRLGISFTIIGFIIAIIAYLFEKYEEESVDKIIKNLGDD